MGATQLTDPDDGNHAIDHELQRQLAGTGNILITFHRVTNVRQAGRWKNVPSMRQYEQVPEKALKGSSVSHKTTYV
jgi:hypothetical protein